MTMKRSLPPLFLLLLLSACKPKAEDGQGGAPSMPPAPVTLEKVMTQELVEWQELTGRVEAVESVELRPRVSGYLTEVCFQAGSQVQAGEVLFRIDPRRFQTQLRAAKAEVQRARANAAAMEREYKRVSALLSAKAISPEQAEGRQSMHEQAQAALEAALAAEHSAEILLEYTEVKAPIRGQVSRALLTTGNFVTEGVSILTTLVSTDPVHVYADLDENSLLKLQALQREKKTWMNAEGRMPVELQLADEKGYPHKGYIESLDNRLEATTGSLLVRCSFENPTGKLLPGLFARLRLPMTGKYPAVVITESSVLTDQGNKYVLGVDETKQPLLSVYKPVVLGPVVEGKRIIRSGLKAGERIVQNGQSRIFIPGMPVAESAGANAGAKP
jgi:RND family efflux transporter MFP subunit